MTDDQQPDQLEQTGQQPEPERAGPATGFAAYDNTLRRFVGPVRSTKTDARADVKNAASGHDVEVREV